MRLSTYDHELTLHHHSKTVY
eukprot:COSAG01_NODE_26815_length_702_cov_1.235489_1_plen_20_part_10